MSGQTIGAIVCAILFVPLLAGYLMFCAFIIKAMYEDLFK